MEVIGWSNLKTLLLILSWKADVLTGAAQISLSNGNITISTDGPYDNALSVWNDNYLQRLLSNNTQFTFLV